MTIQNLEEANRLLAAFVPPRTHLTVRDTQLDRILPLMALLGNPQDTLKMVHIAGTSGKTSTAYYMAALLRAGGQKVGLTVSPHIDSVTERVQIDGLPLAEALFCSELGVFLDIVRTAERQPSYFEVVYAFAIWEFVRSGVDYAVIETGVGGLLDATNIADRPDKVCIITDIGLDHTHLLGKTLPLITAQKIGIVHKANHVFMYKQADEIMEVVREWTVAHDAPLTLVDEAENGLDFVLGMPEYQRRNWLLAYKVYQYLAHRDHLPDLLTSKQLETQTVKVPARMDISVVKGKTLIMDGAHNQQKMTAFVDSFGHLYPNVRPAILLAVKDGKDPTDYQAIVKLLTPLASRIIVTVFTAMQDMKAVSVQPKQIARAFKDAGAENVRAITDQHEAYGALIVGPEEICILTGSFYLLSQIRNNEALL